MDAAIWQKAPSVIERTPSLKQIVVLGEAPAGGRAMIGFAAAAESYRGDALAFAAEVDVDLVLRDIHLHGRDGSAIHDRVRGRRLSCSGPMRFGAAASRPEDGCKGGAQLCARTPVGGETSGRGDGG